MNAPDLSAAWSTGIGELDDDHRRLLGEVARLEEAVTSGQGKSVVHAILADVATEALNHFAREEEMLFAHRFPGAEAHRREHERIAQTIWRAFKIFVDSDDRNTWRELAVSLLDELIRHMVYFDMRYKWFFADRGLTRLSSRLAMVRGGATRSSTPTWGSVA